MTSLLLREILTLGVEHEFNGGGYRDVDFIVPGATLRQLRRGHMIARAGEGNLTVACEGADGAPVMPLDGISLVFGVRARTASFGAVTAFPFDLPATVAHYTNAADRRALADPAPVTLTGPELRHVLSGAARPVTVTATDALGGVVATRIVPAGALDPSLSLDLRGREFGLYMVEEAVAGGAGQRRSYYLQPELQRHGLFAVVAVALRSDFYGAPAVLRLSFRAKEQPLRYYVIASNYNATEFDQLNIADLGFTDDLRPEIRFTRVAAAGCATDELAPALLGAPDARVTLFRSQAALPRRLAPRRRLQLSRNGTVLAGAARVAVEASGIKGLALESDDGTLDPAKPFQPSGAEPTAGSRLLIGCPEAFSKELSELSLEVVWKGVPPSFVERYRNYGVDGIDQNYFTASLLFHDGGAWRQSSSNVPMFASDGAARVGFTFRPSDTGTPATAAGKQIYALMHSGGVWAEAAAERHLKLTPMRRADAEAPLEPPKRFAAIVLNRDFLHSTYRTRLLPAALTIPPLQLKEPYTPAVQELSLAYKAYSNTVNMASASLDDYSDLDVMFFHIGYGESTATSGSSSRS